jgi:hypothetical protein
MNHTKKTPTMSATKRRLLMGTAIIVLGLEWALSQTVPTNHVVMPLTNSVNLATVAKLTPTPAAGATRDLHLATPTTPMGNAADTVKLQHPLPPAVTPITVARPVEKLDLEHAAGQTNSQRRQP